MMMSRGGKAKSHYLGAGASIRSKAFNATRFLIPFYRMKKEYAVGKTKS